MTQDQPKIISSPHNPHVKRWVSLLEPPGIKRHQQCLLSGMRIGTELLRQSPTTMLELLIPDRKSQPDIPGFTGPVYRLANQLFQQLDIYGTHAPLWICRIPGLSLYDLTASPQGLEILCPMGDPGNLGSLLRGCWVFGVDRVILLDESVHPFHPKVIRASSGAVFSLNIYRGCAIGELGKSDIAQWITALDMTGDDMGTWDWPEQIRLLIGEEGTGLPPVSFAHRLKISQVRESIPLNASVAGNIALYAYRQTYPSIASRRSHS
ncbi:MAG: TrmH family RNA methyltransferase [Nitrospirales bacterium]